jgi:DNA-binding PadR family transcriptional regulator
MPIPEISSLQFLLLAALADGERSGRELRELLAKQKHKKSAPAFYQLMSRMEDARLVKGWYDQKLVEGQFIKERVYTITSGGIAAFTSAREFFMSLAAGYGWKGHSA